MQASLEIPHETRRRNEPNRESYTRPWTGSPDRGQSGMRGRREAGSGRSGNGIGRAASPGPARAIRLARGKHLPRHSRGAPRANLTYEGAVYNQTPLGTDDAANLNESDLELVGTTTESNILFPGGGESLNIHRLKGGEEGYVYTLEPGRSYRNEDGNAITIEAEWIRWTAADSDGT